MTNHPNRSRRRTHRIIVAEISDGNVRSVRRHNVTTARGVARLAGHGTQIWMTREAADALGAVVETFWGTLPDGTEIQIKTPEVMERA